MSQTDFFYGVDGTGEKDNATYKKNFANSHVRNIWKTWQGPGWYMRGPTDLGSETPAMAQAVVKKAEAFWTDMKKTGREGGARIFLSGYSRGGAAVIEAAYFLDLKGIPVHALLLFDAVDRATGIRHSDSIPKNVSLCYHAFRANSAGSREMFGRTGTRFNPAWTDYKYKAFKGTHGAIGGTPWIAPQGVSQDAKIEELTPEQRRKLRNGRTVARGVSPLGEAVLGPIIQREADKNTVTNMTFREDGEASKRAGNWMKQQLAEAMNTMAGITVVGKKRVGRGKGRRK
ncbi:hypothetical protein [Jannaschia pohangensis]|uniref:DUF2235 domain-containing protein n=1 Tax=Jannaschia pohangensis TaxID=390807 RepID=A0A1I3UIQ1_9RHOB|nr:hypothetical protein [Jannaschia pohangensis]SFJ83364.1 hypothetical protein SAMN04488095_3787 [Jannaschia pohangensis]